MNFNDQVKISTMTKNLITKRDAMVCHSNHVYSRHVSTLKQFFDYTVWYLLLYLPVNMQEVDRVKGTANSHSYVVWNSLGISPSSRNSPRQTLTAVQQLCL